MHFLCEDNIELLLSACQGWYRGSAELAPYEYTLAVPLKESRLPHTFISIPSQINAIQSSDLWRVLESQNTFSPDFLPLLTMRALSLRSPNWCNGSWPEAKKLRVLELELDTSLKHDTATLSDNYNNHKALWIATSISIGRTYSYSHTNVSNWSHRMRHHQKAMSGFCRLCLTLWHLSQKSRSHSTSMKGFRLAWPNFQ